MKHKITQMSSSYCKHEELKCKYAYMLAVGRITNRLVYSCIQDILSFGNETTLPEKSCPQLFGNETTHPEKSCPQLLEMKQRSPRNHALNFWK